MLSFRRLLLVLATTFTVHPPHLMAQSPDFDVRNFGAACNGASDDAPALQAAINALPSSGGNLLIPCKLGIGSAGVKLASKSNITVRGTAAGAGIRSLAPTGQGAQGFGP